MAADAAVARLTSWRKEPKEIRFAGTVEQQVLFFPEEIEEGGFVDPFANGIQTDVWLEQVRRQNEIYNASVDQEEDERLKDD